MTTVKLMRTYKRPLREILLICIFVGYISM